VHSTSSFTCCVHSAATIRDMQLSAATCPTYLSWMVRNQQHCTHTCAATDHIDAACVSEQPVPRTAMLLVGDYILLVFTPYSVASCHQVTRAALGGLLVGVGAALGNGCTSGHGISGNARLSVRSMAYT
jgi:uncharacterized membrane protein YedE/YeeE